MKKVVITIETGEVSKDELNQFGAAIEIAFPKAKRITIEVKETVTEERTISSLKIK